MGGQNDCEDNEVDVMHSAGSICLMVFGNNSSSSPLAVDTAVVARFKEVVTSLSFQGRMHVSLARWLGLLVRTALRFLVIVSLTTIAARTSLVTNSLAAFVARGRL